MKEETQGTAPATIQASEPVEPPPAPRETVVTAPTIDSTPNTSPTFQATSKTPSRRVLRLKCPVCTDYPDGFRSEHELRRHTNRVHRKTRKVWITIDTSPDKTFLANCKACQTGKKYNECYNAASHLRRMHFHPHKRGERKMTAAEARRGGKPGDLDPPMEVLKANWLREVDEIVGEDNEPIVDDVGNGPVSQPQLLPQPAQNKSEGKAPPTPTTPSTRSMAIDSIVDKMDAS
ncbi:Nn.00g033670.m01.CDS01 [Neocucurbitaria sp. VM-36]